MAGGRNEAEEIVENSLRGAARRGQIRLVGRFFQKLNRVGSKSFSSPAPIDFYVCDTSGRIHLIEVKQTEQTSFSWANMRAEQAEWLRATSCSWLVLRVYTGGLTRASNAYSERYYWLHGPTVVPSVLKRSLSLQEAHDRDAFRHCGEMVGYQQRTAIGIGPEAGRNRNDSPTRGFERIPDLGSLPAPPAGPGKIEGFYPDTKGFPHGK